MSAEPVSGMPMKAARALLAAAAFAVALLLLLPVVAHAADPAALRFSVEGDSEVLTATADDLLAAEQTFTANAEPAVQLRFAPGFAARFADFTARNIGKSMTISRGGETLHSARVMERIAGGSIQISGGFSIAEAKALAQKLKPRKPPTPPTPPTPKSADESPKKDP